MSISKIRAYLTRASRPIVAIGAVLVAVGVAYAVTSVGINSGTYVATLGDTAVAVLTLSQGDSSLRGPVFYVDTTTAANIGEIDTKVVKHLKGSIAHATGVATGSVKDVEDSRITIQGSFSLTFAGPDTSTGTHTERNASTSYAAGCTRHFTFPTSLAFNDTVTAPIARLTAATISGTVGTDTRSLALNRTLILSAGQADDNNLLNSAADTRIQVLHGANLNIPNVSGETHQLMLVYNDVRDSFISVKGIVADSSTSSDSLTNNFTIRVETGTNYIYHVVFGDSSDSIGVLKRDTFTAARDSVALLVGTIIITDTAAGGATATGNANGAGAVITATTDSRTSFSLTGDIGLTSVSLVVTPYSPTSVVVVSADSNTSGETHLSSHIYDYTILDNNGAMIASLAATAFARVEITVCSTETNTIINNGWGLIYIDQATNQWRDLAELDLNNAIDRIGGNGSSCVTGRADLRSIPGVIIGWGSVPTSGPLASDDGGTCLFEAAFNGTSLEAALPVIRSARDMALGSTAGRFLSAAYYSVFGIVALIAFGGAAYAFRKNG